LLERRREARLLRPRHRRGGRAALDPRRVREHRAAAGEHARRGEPAVPRRGARRDRSRRRQVILPEVKLTADPYRDLDVIDSRAPRFNQATIGALSALAVATGWWWLLGVLAAQLAVGLTLGRRYCLPCLAYFELVQPRFGEGRLEDSRPPRFANLVGAVFLGAATVSYGIG